MRVLVVDDLKDAARSMAMLVRHFGHAVDVAYDGYEAIAAVEGFRPDLVLLDLGLPGKTGYEVCAWIKMGAATKHIRVVAVSGFAEPKDRIRTAALGFEAHHAKPIDPAELERLLNT
jgi:two-component system CheB/CheR fusion protein